MKDNSNWTRLLLFFLFWILSSIVIYIPLILLFPDIFFNSKGEQIRQLDNSSTYLIINQLLSICSIFIAIFFIIKKIEMRDFSEIKLTVKLAHLFKGFFGGVCLFTIVAFTMELLGIIDFIFIGIDTKIFASLLLYLIVAMGEELVVRGYILNNLLEKMNPFLSILFSSLFFGAMHILNDDFTLIGFANIIFSGFLMGILLIKSDTISAPIGLHWAWNFIQGPIVGFNVSGHKETGVFQVKPLASDFLTGGAFGAEGSIVLIPIVLVAIYTVWKYYGNSTIEVIN